MPPEAPNWSALLAPGSLPPGGTDPVAADALDRVERLALAQGVFLPRGLVAFWRWTNGTPQSGICFYGAEIPPADPAGRLDFLAQNAGPAGHREIYAMLGQGGGMRYLFDRANGCFVCVRANDWCTVARPVDTFAQLVKLAVDQGTGRSLSVQTRGAAR